MRARYSLERRWLYPADTHRIVRVFLFFFFQFVGCERQARLTFDVECLILDSNCVVFLEDELYILQGGIENIFLFQRKEKKTKRILCFEWKARERVIWKTSPAEGQKLWGLHRRKDETLGKWKKSFFFFFFSGTTIEEELCTHCMEGEAFS